MLFPLSYRRKWPPSLLTEPVYHTKRPPTTRNKPALSAADYGVAVPDGCGVTFELIDTWTVP